MMSIKDHQNGPAMHLSNTVQVFLLLDAGLAQRARIIPKLNSYVHNSSNISTVNDCVWSLGSLPGSISKPGFYRYNQSFVSMRISKAWLCQLILVFHAMTARWCMTQWFICEPTSLRQMAYHAGSTVAQLVDRLPHGARGPGLIMILPAIYVAFAPSPYDHVGFLRVLWFPLTSQTRADWYINWPLLIS